MFLICLDYVIRTSTDPIKENDFTLKTQEEDYTDDLAHLANTPARAESLPHILEQAARGIGLFEDPFPFQAENL